MLLSIIIPAYNAAETITRSLDSVLNQSYQNLEVIVVNDGSSDKTEEILKDYASRDKRIKYIYKDNGGVSSARNLGMLQATGDYISFLDCDDSYRIDFAKLVVNKIGKVQPDLIFCGFNKVIDNKVEAFNTKFSTSNILKNYLLGVTAVQTAGWIIRREFLIKREIFFLEGYSWGEDVEFFSKVLSKNPALSFIEDYLVNYYVGHSEDQLSNFSLKQIDLDYQSNQRLIAYFSENTEIQNVIIRFRMQSSIVFKLAQALEVGADTNMIKQYYEQYATQIQKNYWDYGIKSVKLNIKKVLVFRKINSL